MLNGNVVAIFIAPVAGGKMEEVEIVEAIAGAGLAGDRYSTGEGSFNRKRPGSRQVTLINSIFFQNSGFEYAESRRNIVTQGVPKPKQHPGTMLPMGGSQLSAEQVRAVAAYVYSLSHKT